MATPEERERRLTYHRAYYAANREKLIAQKKAAYQENKEEVKAYKRAFYAKNKERIAPQHREYYQKNKKWLVEKVMEWQAKNPEKRAGYEEKVRLRILTENRRAGKRQLKPRVHVLTAVDECALSAVCNTCGPVKITKRDVYRGKTRYKCCVATREHSWRQSGIDITIAQYEEKLKNQDGLCAVCRNASPEKALAVDHCHKTGKVRDLLCSNCNLALGLIQDSPSLALQLALYLERHQSQTLVT